MKIEIAGVEAEAGLISVPIRSAPLDFGSPTIRPAEPDEDSTPLLTADDMPAIGRAITNPAPKYTELG